MKQTSQIILLVSLAFVITSLIFFTIVYAQAQDQYVRYYYGKYCYMKGYEPHNGRHKLYFATLTACQQSLLESETDSGN